MWQKGLRGSLAPAWAALLFASLLCPSWALGQTIGGAVNEHVDDHLKSGKKAPKKKGKKKHHSSGPSHEPAQNNWRPGPAPPPKPKPQGEQLPYRVFGKSFQLDPTTSLAYRGWRPQAYPSLDVSTQNDLTWSIGARAKLWVVSVTQAHYESNAAGSPRRQGASTAAKAAQATPVASWFVGALGFPVDWVLEPIIRYETRAFETTLTPKKPVRVIPFSASQYDDLSLYPATSEELLMTSAFETFVVGLKYHHENDPTGIISTEGDDFPALYFGVGLAQYSKPYMVRVGGAVLDELLFDARMRGAGLALGLDTGQKPERFFLELNTQFGIGEVQLTHDFTVNETLPDGWLIGYAQGELTAGYLHPITRTRPTLLGGLAGSIGGATFYYFKPLTTEEEQSNTSQLNWDLLWGLRVFLVLPL